MSIRTDLAIESCEGKKSETKGYLKREKKQGEVSVTEIEIADDKQGFQKGKYITVEFPSPDRIADFEQIEKEITGALSFLLPKRNESVLVVGLGNSEITADSIGPRTAARLLATRHIVGDFAEKIGLKGLKNVAVVTPNVLGKTGIEATELVEGLVKKIKPQAVIVIDALASGSIKRLFRTVQLSNTGISPGSGVKNARKELSEKTLGVPVIALGVPTVVDALALAWELTEKEPVFDTDLIVSPKDADLLCHKISEILSKSLNLFLQPEIDRDVLLSLV